MPWTRWDCDDSEHRIAALDQLAEGKRAVRQTPEETLDGSGVRAPVRRGVDGHPASRVGCPRPRWPGFARVRIGVAVDAGLSVGRYTAAC